MLRLILAICLGKLIYFLTRFFKKGGGSAAPGYYALKISPDLVGQLSSQIPTNIIITGTNGKTTTSRLFAHFAKAEGLRIIRNSTGSNLERGLASELIKYSSLFGQIKKIDLGIWETDEAAFNLLLPKLNPKIVVFLNAVRDQLDRYGEVDTVVKNWRIALSKITDKPILILNANDENVFSLRILENIEFKSFGLKKQFIKWEKVSSNSKKFDYEAISINPEELKKIDFTLVFNNHRQNLTLPLPGNYHIYDFLAAFAVSYELNLDPEKVFESLEHYSPAFGRVEKLKIGDKDSYILLIKNPTAATQIFSTISPYLTKKDILMIALNDNFADGKDVSWIWDADFELLSRAIKETELSNIITSGTRAADLAIRLKYSGVETKKIRIEENLGEALKIGQALSGKQMFILPTYTALLDLQNILARQGYKKHYWKEET